MPTLLTSDPFERIRQFNAEMAGPTDPIAESIDDHLGCPVLYDHELLYKDGSRRPFDLSAPLTPPADEAEAKRLQLIWWRRQADIALAGLQNLRAEESEIRAGRGPTLINLRELREQKQQMIDFHRCCERAIGQLESGGEIEGPDVMELIASGHVWTDDIFGCA
jgi:hypothetical protein